MLLFPLPPGSTLEIFELLNLVIHVEENDENNDFISLEDTIDTGTFYTIMLIRSGGNLKIYVNGGDHEDKDWDSDGIQEDSGVFTISNIGASADDTTELNGSVKDVLIYRAALTARQRDLMYSYLDGQLGVS